MKILYVAPRINAIDGSTVHCREFVREANQIGCNIATFPKMKEINYLKQIKVSKSKRSSFFPFEKFSYKRLFGKYHRILGFQSEIVLFLEGLIDSILQFRPLQKKIIAFKPDVIIFRNIVFFFTPFWVKKKYNIPLLLEINGLRSIEGKIANKKNKISIITYWSEKKALAYSDATFCVSMQLREYVYKYKPKKIVKFIPNGVETHLFNPGKFNKNEIKKNLGLSDKKVVGYVGSYKKWHGLNISLETIELLVNDDKNYHLVLIGSGKEFNNVKETIRAKRLSSYVTQIPFVPHEEVAKHIACFDFALMTYPPIRNFYFSPLKLFEYMAMGIPVVASSLGQIKEIVDDKINGILVDPPTPKRFADGILEAQKHYDKIANNSRRLMISDYSWQKNSQKVMAMCKNLIENRF